MTTPHLLGLYAAIYKIIRKIPRGRVVTYGQLAELAGIPGGARIAAASLKVSKPSDALPWQRVIGKSSKLRGRIAIHDPVGAAIQRELLASEGVAISDTGLVALDVYGWLPDTTPDRPNRQQHRPKRKEPARRRAGSSKQPSRRR